MKRLAQEARVRQGVVDYAGKHGKSEAARKYGVSLSSVKRWGKRYDGTWQRGRQLASLQKGSTAVNYGYGEDGLRTKKTVSGAVTNYHWNDLDQLVEQDGANGTLLFYHDDKGDIGAFVFNGAKYNFRRNAQGDVTAILDLANNIVAKYTYDAWGKVLSVTDANGNAITAPNHIANVNPIRYRGYYYDTETGLYYLNSRYYDPQTGRFLNADDTDVLDVQGDLHDNNLFVYCDNNPIVRADHGGDIWDFIDFIFAAWSWGDFIAKPSWGNFGWAMLDTVCLLPLIPSVGYVTRPAKIISKASKTTKVARGFGKLSKAGKYGIKSYKALKTALRGTGLQAHHIIEQRLAKVVGQNANNMLSVAVTVAEHRKFTNVWRKLIPYGSNYSKLTKSQIWRYAQQVYKGYPELLKAAKKTIFR